MVRAHIFICMLAAHVQWHMQHALKELLFNDEALEIQKEQRPSPVGKTERSESAKRKSANKKTPQGLPVQSFNTLLKELGSLSKSTCKANIAGAPTFEKISLPTPLQLRAFELLNLPVPKV
jgi:hypothetical protein